MWYLFGLWRFELSKTSGPLEGLNELRSIRAVQLMDRNGIPGPEADNKTVTGRTHSTHRGFDEVHQRCYEEKCCKPMARIGTNGEKRSNLRTKLSLMVVNLFGSFREGCWRIFSERGSGLYFWASLSCRSWIFLAIYVSESSSDMNPWRTWPVVSCVTVNF